MRSIKVATIDKGLYNILSDYPIEFGPNMVQIYSTNARTKKEVMYSFPYRNILSMVEEIL